MKLIFTKGAGKTDQMEVVRAGQPSELVACPKQGIIPHDMVHYAVEHTLGARGFLTRVVAGEAAAFRMDSETLSDAVERLVEVFQGDGWSGGTAPASELIDLYRITCNARSSPMLAVDEAAIAAVRAVIADLTSQWRAVAVGASFELGFAPDACAS